MCAAVYLQRWQRHCMDLHKQRLAEMKHQVDTKQPETFDIQLSKGKRAMLEKERQFEIDRVSSASHGRARDKVFSGQSVLTP